MWVLALFDLPVDKPESRREYTRFRKELLDDGFTMMQYSVYQRHCASWENTQVHIQRMGDEVPPRGEVRFLVITDHQYGKILTFRGKKRQPEPAMPTQLEFF
ncbi:MAG TPA: CRISPR-associated endonuclease Cas2 [Candidatus Xenobia bacterium]|nr:CRISPR-associated endonuclease Cas2 [Candidatus Xenobia bacterium]